MSMPSPVLAASTAQVRICSSYVEIATFLTCPVKLKGRVLDWVTMKASVMRSNDHMIVQGYENLTVNGLPSTSW